MKIIGLTYHKSGVHDNSVALLENGKVLFAEAEERISRIKHDGRFPYLALKEGLNLTKNKLKNINYFVSATPNENYIQMFLTTVKFLPTVGLGNYLEQMIGALTHKIDKVSDDDRPKNIQEMGISESKFFTVSHYFAHAVAAYYTCPFDKCLVINMDGFGPGDKGEPLSGQIYLGENNKLIGLEVVPVHASLGLYYGVITMALGFKLNDGEGKTMGLAAYGDPAKCYKKVKNFFPRFIDNDWIVKSSIMDILNVSRKKVYVKSSTYKYLKKLVEDYGKEDVAAACQLVFEEELVTYISHLIKKYKVSKVALNGGIFLNVKANMRLLEEKVVDDLYVYPNPSDGGTAMGAALAGFITKGQKIKRQELLHPAYSREYKNSEIITELKKTKGIEYKKLGTNLPRIGAKLLFDGKVVGWFEGRGEWGPRALGQRSVIADPRHLETKNRINNILKGREWFMPFAPSMAIEGAPKYLKMLRKAPFMIIGDRIMPGMEKDLKAAAHIDETVRPHLVTREANKLYYQVIKEFEKLTGVPTILNTSFNKHGLPIVYTPRQAVEHLLWGAIDELIIGSYHVWRK
ncbi:hypothetical protein A2130_03660 [Candidatus Woesebacteria bacterium GWC2_33_12]|uniref:Carbamoyltransferase n=1 Tax=Candidatus Woesebacteria bacterium GW2011_GWB1_33_22 TaxID=1618566 RepID=A0A0G0A2P9_9BACT|nr:MAG: Carbamoyltransferase [Candidatus Woesebacteria bacterium GW2011_GWC2_33_12]KKP42739.1 MAG: Carbamoyltransferase [Candidatus Woesebacteria bacterium GW2011_GWA2_33_20]KKP45486.1 MAG: Carbamoyltransferase [Candidatus Woesebacteria bacterium GW2011_GWB1_33_22]KKP47358.1 MAG: Carbamoyltransferase [Microgenomates group bacterium GW2011_GWC1_33_28]KKP51104.1 MAG: Carbamoyltransferase [Candidatus Woesebacteria bacterium GW2011_GWA1_33_33]OGM06898.1 MAG: hypothetical protein A2130_03660 [Candi